MINIVPNLIALNNAVNLMNLSIQQQRQFQQEEDERHRRRAKEQQAMIQRRRMEEENNERKNNTHGSVHGQYDFDCVDPYGNPVQKFKTCVDVSPVSSEEEKREIEEMLDAWTEKRRGEK